MKSHEYDFALTDVLKLIGWPLVPVGWFAVVMHLGAALNVFPLPRPTLDIDRTILLHQAEASRARHDADMLLIGDSSCLMDVSARPLAEALPGQHHVLNLGTLSYLDLPAYAGLLRNYVTANPGRLRTVVLLMHPEALRRVAPVDYHVELVRNFQSGIDLRDPASPPLVTWLGTDIFKARFLSRILPVPLHGNYGQQYGFTTDLWRYLSDHDGSAVDPGTFDRQSAQGNAEYRVSPKLETASQAFKAEVPAGIKLIVGITPAPEGFVITNYRQQYSQMLREWSQWLGADTFLENLPATLPDKLFSSTTHLNESGQRIYTGRLAQTLADYLGQL